MRIHLLSARTFFLPGLLLILALYTLSTTGCNKERFILDPQAKLSFSEDTLQFDTVFTTVGSVTRDFKVFNTHNERILIDQVRLVGGSGSQFRINVDGVPGPLHEAIEIGPNDSIYVFVEVTVDPNAENLPFILEDSVEFMTNGNTQRVVLAAWGQNAHFFSGQRICDQTWENDKPYVIYNYIQIDSNCTLTIMEGCRVHFHANSGMLIDGNLNVQGSADSAVTFEGDRLEAFFEDQPGQWDGLFFLRGSTGNQLDYAVIKNATSGISSGFSKAATIDDLSDFNAGNMPEIELKHSMIHDCLDNGILALQSDIICSNTLVYNSGSFNVALFMGGRYDFNHTTLANYGSVNLNHQTPVLGFSNFFFFGQNGLGQDIIGSRPLEQADVTNSIIYGNLLDNEDVTGLEISLGDIEDGTLFNYNFDHCLIRTDFEATDFNNSNSILNEDPLFTERSAGNYHLNELSPAIDVGISTFISDDLDGNPRPFMGTPPDMGAFEFGYEEE